MIEVYNCYSKLTLDSTDFTRILKGINEAGYKSVIWQSKVKFLETAGIKNLSKEILDWIGYYNVKGTNSFIYRADLFVEGKSVIYITNESSGFSSPDRRIEIGVISDSALEANEVLIRYVKQFEVSLKANVDGRKVRHMEKNWYHFSKNDKLDTHVTYYKLFQYPVMADTESQAASIISDNKLRQVLRRIAEHESFKTQHVKGELKDSILETVNELINHNLVTKRYVVSCKKNSTPIGVVRLKEELSKSVLSCPHCGRNFIDEQIQESFLLSDLGRKMTSGSHWMTILLTKSLIECGIPENSIIWNLTEDSEEVDCVVQFKDKTWIFELKDRDFEPGDAHPLTYRAVKFKAHKTIIFTTGKVTKEARKVFQDMAQHSIGSKTSVNPLYIEGVAALKEALQILINNETLLHVSDKAKQLSLTAGSDFSPIFLSLFGKYRVEYKGEFKDDVNIFRY
ncbi:hypothetical protein [Mucilaginibacter sp. OK283]|jgi:hypothetical protein|uniref:hypothetical protein n=1 Tax=Mucilaginibacter sp. OK283 TaxID=1881049 RepID=UPI0008D8C10B|nr:hypothetical protein [Mucilaginibacter sp. OK283]SEO51884.1 hypothetical protein SAMN05428947_102653 [Mucilaginibacter sp. OK283]